MTTGQSITHRFMSRVLPHPLVSLLVFASWLMLAHSFSSGNIVLAIILGLTIPKIMQNFIVHTPNIRWLPAIELFFVVLWDIIVSNFRVAKLVLGPADRLHPKWFRVPLETKHEQVNSLLAMIITTTPGTVSAGIDQQRGDILVHSLNTVDEQFDIDDIKARYEMRLIQIFNAAEQTNEGVNP